MKKRKTVRSKRMIESWHTKIVQEHEPFGAKCDWHNLLLFFYSKIKKKGEAAKEELAKEKRLEFVQ